MDRAKLNYVVDEIMAMAFIVCMITSILKFPAVFSLFGLTYRSVFM
jgi:hypothetical protein